MSGGWPGCCASTARSATPSQIGRAIVRARAARGAGSTQQLVDTIKSAVPVPAQFAGGHPARRTFQALRIAVNDELAQLDAALPAAWELLGAGRAAGRDLLPLARGSARQALPGGSGARVRVSAGAADLRLRPRSGGRAADPPCGGADAGGGRRQPSIQISALARRPQAGGHADMTPTALTPAAAASRPRRAAATGRPAARRPSRGRPEHRAGAGRRGRSGHRRRRRPASPRPGAAPRPGPAARRGPARARAAHRAAGPRRPRAGRSAPARWPSSRRCPTISCWTGSSAAGPGSRCSACCWPGSSPCRWRCSSSAPASGARSSAGPSCRAATSCCGPAWPTLATTSGSSGWRPGWAWSCPLPTRSTSSACGRSATCSGRPRASISPTPPTFLAVAARARPDDDHERRRDPGHPARPPAPPTTGTAARPAHPAAGRHRRRHRRHPGHRTPSRHHLHAAPAHRPPSPAARPARWP